jgi:hypothetical protein
VRPTVSGSRRRVASGGGGGAVQPFFADDFAGGQTNPANGFTFSNDRGALTNCTIVASGSPGAQVEAGYTHSLRSTFAGGALGTKSQAQINFSFGRRCDPLWFEWRVHIPSNYVHRNNYTPPSTGESDNNKFWMLWATLYSGGYHQAGLDTNPDVTAGTGTSNGKSYSRPLMRYSTNGVYTDIPGGGAPLIGAGELMVPGTWNTVRGYVKKETTQGAGDGEWTCWINGTVLHHFTGLTMGAQDAAKFADNFDQGYFLGYSNSGFTDQTVFHTQWVKFYDQNPGWDSAVQPFFSDDFAGTARNNANGFTWDTSDVDVQPVTFDGYNCLRFRYGPNAIGEDSSAEQGFNLGRDLTELWIEYDLHIPANFVLRNEPQANNKFLALWGADYNVGTTALLEYEYAGSTASSVSKMLSLADLYPGQLVREGDRFRATSFLTAALGGTWQQVRVHYRHASGPGATDGVFEGWFGGALQFRSRTDWVFWQTGGSNYMRNGYLMGWANSGFADETDFHIRGIKFYDSDPQWGMV